MIVISMPTAGSVSTKKVHALLYGGDSRPASSSHSRRVSILCILLPPFDEPFNLNDPH